MTPHAFSSRDLDCALRAAGNPGESPLWSAHEQALYWVDILGQAIHRFHPATGSDETFPLPDEVTALGLRQQGGLVLTLRHQFAFYDPARRELTRGAAPEPGEPQNRFNDGKVDRQGRFWAGTMNDQQWAAPTGALYRLDPDGRITRLQGDVACANGLGWSPDNRTFYFGESFRYAIFAYDFDPDTGHLANRRLFAAIDRAGGAFPDGLTVDADGGVWSVHNAVGRVVRYDPRGQITHTVALPVPQPTSVMFGGAHLDTLYITTSRQNMSPDQRARYPLSGSLFALRPGLRGLPEPAFTG